MNINIPERLRGILYILTALGSLFMIYLSDKDVLGTPEIALWSGITTFISLLARFNLGDAKDAPANR